MDGRQRATTETLKQHRRAAILAAAWALFQESSYAAVMMADVAARAGLAKGTVYLYFPTKEALFLAVAEQQLADWFAEVDAWLRAAPNPLRAEEVTAFFVGTVEARPGLTRLLALLHGVLEQNVDASTALGFKQMLQAHLAETGALLEARLPWLAPGLGARLLLRINALVIGLQQLAEPAPALQPLLQDPALALFRVD